MHKAKYKITQQSNYFEIQLSNVKKTNKPTFVTNIYIYFLTAIMKRCHSRSNYYNSQVVGNK